MGRYLLYCAVYLLGVFISAIAQILLKKSAINSGQKNIFSFLNKHAPRFAEKARLKNGRILRIMRANKKLISEYLNLPTIIAYSIFAGATFLTIFSYKVVPLSVAPILGSSEYIFVAILSKVILKEKLCAKRICGLCVIIIGVLIFSI